MSKKIITNKQHIILILLLIFRFINSKQVQEFLNHKDHRRINSWLKDLVEKGYIERDFKAVYGTLTKPAIYFLTAKGRNHLKSSYTYHFPKYLKRIARDNKASKSFRIKSQIIGDWYLSVFPNVDNKSKDNNKEKTKIRIDIVDTLVKELTTDTLKTEEKIPLNTLQFFTPAYFPSFVLLKELKPDAYLRKRSTKGVTHGFLFVLDAYIPRFLLRYTLKRIFDTLDEETWEEESIESLHFFFLCPNNQIIIYIKKLLPSYLQKYYGSKVIKFNFTTRTQLYKKKKGEIQKIPWVTMSSDQAFDN